MIDIEPNLGHVFDEFGFGQIIAVHFQVDLLNFQTAKKPEAKFDYTLRLVTVYLVQPTEEPEFSTPSRRKLGPDKWMILPLRTKTLFSSLIH